jgi:hypothetical protein
MSDTAADLYEKDFVLWTKAQAAGLREAARAGTNLPLDWENLAEEIEGLGASDKRELRGRLGRIIEHLLKLEHSPAKNPRRGWMETIARERRDIEDLLETSPSLRREVPAIIAASNAKIARLVAGILFGYGGSPAKLPPPVYTEEQVLGDWLPEPAKRAPRSPRKPRGAGPGKAAL